MEPFEPPLDPPLYIYVATILLNTVITFEHPTTFAHD